jgi:hypothetical protein
MAKRRKPTSENEPDQPQGTGKGRRKGTKSEDADEPATLPPPALPLPDSIPFGGGLTAKDVAVLLELVRKLGGFDQLMAFLEVLEGVPSSTAPGKGAALDESELSAERIDTSSMVELPENFTKVVVAEGIRAAVLDEEERRRALPLAAAGPPRGAFEVQFINTSELRIVGMWAGRPGQALPASRRFWTTFPAIGQTCTASCEECDRIGGDKVKKLYPVPPDGDEFLLYLLYEALDGVRVFPSSFSFDRSRPDRNKICIGGRPQ